MPTLRVDDVELFYEERGEGPPLVFLHGLGSSSADWAFQLEHFSERFRCVAFDLPGSGRSKDLKHPQGPFTIGGYARAVAAAMKQLGLAPAHVVGLSMGGMTGLQLALDAPEVVKSLYVVNASGSVVAGTLRMRLLLGLRAVVTKTLGPPGVARLIAPRLFPRPEQGELRATFIRNMAALEPRTYAAVSSAVMGWSVEERVGQLRCPVVLVASDADYTPVAVKHELARRIPGARVVVVPDAHHALPVEWPDRFNALLDASLEA
jgi:pimeloyl-ACP methyl ester carboxylesterase